MLKYVNNMWVRQKNIQRNRKTIDSLNFTSELVQKSVQKLKNTEKTEKPSCLEPASKSDMFRVLIP